MNRYLLPSVSGALPFSFLLVVLAAGFPSQVSDGPAALQADRALIHAFAKTDKASLNQLLDSEFNWIDSNGKSLTRTQVLESIPSLANSDVDPQVRIYGNTAVIRASRGHMHVLRIWLKQETGWRVVLYQEVKQVEKSEPPTSSPGSSECDNPCKTIPIQPETPSEKEAIASWQGVMRAMANNDADAYAPLIADEFTATDTQHDRPYTKPDRLAQIKKQNLAGVRFVPPTLLSAQMRDFGDTVMMIAREQRPGGKPYYNTRMWVKRDGRWQMLFSFNTRIE
jgi:Domain of unknown function (DUF4440)